MNDTGFVRHTDDDGSIYAVEVVSPQHNAYDAKYGVDLVRASTDRYDMEHEQRLRLGEYASWGEAEEHQRGVESALEKDGLSGLGDDAKRVAQMPYLDGLYLAVVFPTDDSTGDTAKVHLLYLSGEQVTSALIADGRTEAMETLCGQLDQAWAEGGNERLLDTAQHEAELRGQIDPDTPLFTPEDRAFRHIDGGGTAHWFAVVENREPEAEPYELRYFRALETGDGSQHSDSYPVMPLPDDDPDSAWPLSGLEMYLSKGDVYMAQQFAHDVAAHYGQAFPDPLDLPALNPEPEYYFGYGVSDQNNPALEAVKTWMQGSERRFDTFTVAEYGMWDEAQGDESELESTLKTQGLEATMNQAERMAVAGGYLDPQRTDGRVFFENDAPPDPLTTNRDRELTQPQYSIGAISANGEHFLDVMKTWGDDNYERLVIPQPTWDKARLAAETTADLHTSGNLQGAMYLVEQAGIEAGVIDPLRNDPRLFTQGPEDPFTTLRETEIDGELARYGVTWRESYEWAAFAPEEPDTDTVHPYWRMETLPVNDLDGESLGYALHMVVYPNIAHDAERIGSPKMAEDEPFRMLEMVHFETTEAADKFGKEFNSYLQPGLLEGPELAQEVAKLEGLSGAWKTLEGDDLTAYRNAELTLTRDPSDWHPYNPNAEREARIAAEGLYYDPIQQFVKLDEDPKIEPVSPDLDL